MESLDVNELFATSYYTVDTIMSAAWSDAGDAYLLYTMYTKHSRIQETNQPRLNDSFMVKSLGRGRDKFRRIKHILIDLWLIEIIRKKNKNWKFEDKQYIKVKFIYWKSKREAIKMALKNQVTETQSDGNQVTESQSDGFGENTGNTNNLTMWLKLPVMENSVTNALSIKYINAWNTKDKYTTYISWRSDKLDDTQNTKLEIQADTLRNAYWWRPNRKWAKKEFDKLVKTLTQQEMREALLELRLLKFEYRLGIEDINMCNSCVNAINNRTTDEDMIIRRVEAIVEKFSTHKNRNEATREQREEEIREWFSDYLPKWKLWKPDKPSTKEWRINLFEEMDLKWQLWKIYERFPEVNLNIVEADRRAWQIEQKRKWLLK